jgi:hypothetical protein
LIGGVLELRVSVDRVDPGLLDLLAAHGTITRIQHCTATRGVSDLDVAPVLAEALVRAGYRLFGLVPSHQSLEDLFLSLVQTTSDR